VAGVEQAVAAPSMTGGEAVVRALRAHDVELVFGIPGTHTLPIHRHLTANGIRHVTPRHEQGGGYAADGYARVSGRPGVVVATSGPGVINTATPAATAYADSVPLLVVSPAMPTDVEGRDAGFLHEGKDQRGAMEALVSWSRRAGSPAEAAAAIADAFEHFATGRPRPVHVEVPVDVLGERAVVRLRRPRGASDSPLDEAALERAVALLARAERPALILGGGSRAAADDATALAERLGAPVVTTVNGKGVVSERHPLSLGAQIRLPATQRWLAERDVVLAVGTELGESDLWGPPLRLGGRLIRVDVDLGQLDKNAAADVAIGGDARAVLERLLEALAPRTAPPEDLSAARAAIGAEALADGAPFVPLTDALDQALGRDGVLSGDSTMASYYGAVHFLPMDAARRFIYPTGYATLGYALPAAIGAKLAAPERPVIALVGDGGLLFTVAELATAAELGIPLPVLVPNNGGYGEIRAQMQEEQIDPIGVDLRVPDLPALGRAFGGAGLRVDDPAALAPALREALERPGPTVIEVPAPV
jgi:thiamine pyrophosphate-dependent acetolactate synthase large subunit-like protein